MERVKFNTDHTTHPPKQMLVCVPAGEYLVLTENKELDASMP